MSSLYSLDTSPHKRLPSNSFRIAINSPSSSSSSRPSLSLRERTKRMRASYSTRSVWEHRLDSFLLWLNARSWARLRRWVWVLLALGSTWILFGTMVLGRGGEDVVDDGNEAPPKVDRTAMEKLRLLELHWGTSEEADLRGVTNDGTSEGSGDSPPLVALIPDVIRPNPLLPAPLSKLSASLIDSSLCPSRAALDLPCSFLLPAFLGEQETKAQTHLYQLGLLALSLNRTLVLPNVQKSRLGTCFANPFDFYYERDSLDRLGVETIQYDEFLEWSARREPAPSAQIVSMANAKSGYPEGAIEIDSGIVDAGMIPNKPTRNLCLRPPKTRLNFLDHSPLVIYPPEGYHKTELKRNTFGKSVVNTLESKTVRAKASRRRDGKEAQVPNVLVFNYELRYQLLTPSQVITFNPELPLPLPYSPFAYSTTWTDLSLSLATSLSPFISIHWRTETLPSTNLVPCALSLSKKILATLEQYPDIKTVYLATDYPIEDLEYGVSFADSTPHSGTFAKAVTQRHHTAFKALLKEFKKNAFVERGVRWTTFIKEERSGRIPLPEELKGALEKGDVGSIAELDPGLVGIIDKGVTIHSEVFLTGLSGPGVGPKESCAKTSSFTNMIVDSRVELKKSQQEEEGVRGQLWNEAGRWNVKGNYVD